MKLFSAKSFRAVLAAVLISAAALPLTAFLTAASPALAADKTLNISYVKAPFNLQLIIMKEQGILEKHMAKLGVNVKWHDITSGAMQAQAMASGDLDIGGVMNSTSALIANGEGNHIKVIAAASRPLQVFAIVAPKGGVTDIAGLKGKIVAGPKGTVLHQLLIAALKKNNMTVKDVQYVQMDIPKALAAIKGNSADAALLAANTVIKSVNAGDVILTTADGYVVPKLMMTASERFVKEHPDQLAAVLAANTEATRWMNDHHAEAIALGAKAQNISEAEAQQLFEMSHFTSAFNEADLKSMDDDMEFLIENNMMRNRVKTRDMFLDSALEK